MEGDIVICHLGLCFDAETAFKNVKDDVELHNALNVFMEGFDKNKVEIFERRKNIVATSEGYFMAYFEGQLELAP